MTSTASLTVLAGDSTAGRAGFAITSGGNGKGVRTDGTRATAGRMTERVGAYKQLRY